MTQPLTSAPLYLISRLVHLNTIRLAHWRCPPCPDSMRALSRLPDLRSLDLSHCVQGSAAAAAAHSMRSLLQGMHSAQQQQQYDADHLPASSSSSSGGSGAFFSKLRTLICTHSDLHYDGALWSLLPGLTCLDLSMSTRYQGHALGQLQLLQTLVLEGTVGWTFCALCGAFALLSVVSALVAVVILSMCIVTFTNITVTSEYVGTNGCCCFMRNMWKWQIR